MDELIEFSRRPEVVRIIAEAADNRDVQGAVADYDPLWLRLWELRAAVGDDEMMRYLGAVGFGHAWWLRTTLEAEMISPYAGYQRPDPTWEPPEWRELAAAYEYDPNPFVLRIVLKPGVDRRPTFDASGVRVIYETRPLAYLHLGPSGTVRPVAGGARIGAAGTLGEGTLGGVLARADGRRYGLTCAHVLPVDAVVVQPPGRRRLRDMVTFWRPRGGIIGRCIARSDLEAATPPHYSYAAGDANIVDAALVEMAPNIQTSMDLEQVGSLAGRAPKRQLFPHMIVRGAMRPGRPLRMGAPVPFYTLHLRGTPYRFRELVELRHISRHYGAFGSIQRPSRPGDSGSWVVSDGPEGPEWCASVLGGDGVQGYALFAETIQTWLDENGYDDLTPFTPPEP